MHKKFRLGKCVCGPLRKSATKPLARRIGQEKKDKVLMQIVEMFQLSQLLEPLITNRPRLSALADTLCLMIDWQSLYVFRMARCLSIVLQGFEG